MIELRQKILAGEELSKEQWKKLITTLEASNPGMTHKYMKEQRDINGRNCYEILWSNLENHQQTILDVGCAGGEILRYLPEKIIGDYYGIDISDSEVNSAKSNNQLICHFKVADATDLPFTDLKFDNVISNMFLHIVKQPENVLREIYRVLKPGGHFVSFVRDFQSDTDKMKSIRELVFQFIQKRHPKFQWSTSSQIKASNEIYKNLANQVGFRSYSNRKVELFDHDCYYTVLEGYSFMMPACFLPDDQRLELIQYLKREIGEETKSLPYPMAIVTFGK